MLEANRWCLRHQVLNMGSTHYKVRGTTPSTGQAKGWKISREAAFIEGRQAGNCKSSRDRQDTTENKARSVSKAGIKLTVTIGQSLLTVLPQGQQDNLSNECFCR
jgi:hypothetical protein